MKQKRWWQLNLFGLEIKPIYAIIIGFPLTVFLSGGILHPIGTLLFVLGIIAFVADLITKKNRK